MSESNKILYLLRENKGMIILGGVLIAALSFLFLVVSEKNFRSEIKFLIVQEQAGSQDYYSLSKSAEYLGKIMGEAIHSELFIEEVIKTKKVDEEFLPFDKKDRMEEWAKVVKVSRNYQLGTIEVSVFSNSTGQVKGISEAIIEVLTQKNNLFHGNGQNINVRVISGPIVEKNPTLENIILVVTGGFVLGIILVFGWLYLRHPEIKFYDQGGQINQKFPDDFNSPVTPDEYMRSLMDNEDRNRR